MQSPTVCAVKIACPDIAFTLSRAGPIPAARLRIATTGGIKNALRKLIEIDQRGERLEATTQQNPSAKAMALLMQGVGLGHQIVRSPEGGFTQGPA
jgi:hypothetical protein